MVESPPRNDIKEIRLDSWREFSELTEKLFVSAPAYIYRGQANFDWPLQSGLDRLESHHPKRKNLTGHGQEFFECAPLTEEEHLRAFKHAIRGRRGLNPEPLTEDGCWALGRHHGLATPLLDWTRSPFVALFFAFEEEKCLLSADNWAQPKDRGVYVLSTNSIKTLDEPQGPAVRLLSPDSDTNYRMISQASILIRLPRKTNLEQYVAMHSPAEHPVATFTKIKIPNRDRDECLVALNKMNINHMTLFPDIDGAAKHVNSLWQPGHEDSIAYV